MSEAALFRVGYFARVAPEKGLHVLADAYIHFRRTHRSRARSGSRRPDICRAPTRRISKTCSDRLDKAGLPSEFTYHGAVDRSGKLAFLAVASMCCRCRRPTTSRKACSCWRRWRAACRSCSRGAARSPRLSRRPAVDCWSRRIDPARWQKDCTRCGRTALTEKLGERAFAGVRDHYSIAHRDDRMARGV